MLEQRHAGLVEPSAPSAAASVRTSAREAVHHDDGEAFAPVTAVVHPNVLQPGVAGAADQPNTGPVDDCTVSGGGAGGSGVAEDGATEPTNPCPLCLCDENDSGDDCRGMCHACGHVLKRV